MTNQEKLEELLKLFVEGKINRGQYDELMVHLRKGVEDKDLNNAADRIFRDMKRFIRLTDEEKNQIYQRIAHDPRFKPGFVYTDRKQKLYGLTIWHQIGIAASLLLLITTGLHFYTNKQQAKKYAIETTKSSNSNPVTNRVVLTIDDGSRIILDDAKNDVLATQGGVSIQKIAEGKLTYEFSNSQNSSSDKEGKMKNVYNKIEIPVGRTYQLNLSDGSKVWLNAASSLRYPASFTGDLREVELTGEAYFEVAKDKTKIFKVKSGNQSVEVLGTHFNINAYADEPSINTTLLEGSVRVLDLKTNNSHMLKPGEQSKLNDNIKILKLDNLQSAVAWKDGYFHFSNADIKTVMRQLERWYGVSTRYEGILSPQQFAGAIDRNLTLLQVLDILGNSQIHFRVEGKEVIVMP